MTFKELGLAAPEVVCAQIKVNDTTDLEVRRYLPIDEKAGFIQFVTETSLDENTGCFSPLRLEVYFSLAVCRWYAGIMFDAEDLINAGVTYDLLDQNGVITDIMAAIPESELTFLQELVEETTTDIARYNASAAGIINNMSKSADGLGGQIDEIMKKVKNKEGLELLEEIKNVVGTD